MRSTEPNPPLATMAIFGLLAFIMLVVVIVALYYNGPLAGPAKDDKDAGDGAATSEPTTEEPSETPAATDLVTATATTTLAPTPTMIPTALPTATRTAVPPTAAATAAPTLAPSESATPSSPIVIFLIARDDGGASGLPVGCGDSLVEVTRDTLTAGTMEEQIADALTDLFSIRDQYYGPQRLYNALYSSTLVVDRVTTEGSTALVHLSGNLVPGDDCNRPRIEAQIEGTIPRFGEIDTVQVFVNGTPLETVLYGEP